MNIFSNLNQSILCIGLFVFISSLWVWLFKILFDINRLARPKEILMKIGVWGMLLGTFFEIIRVMIEMIIGIWIS
jgi:uncharacterized membrane protein